ncbi:MAG: hypothetical protein HY727_19710 [Candidatus Rokubacteria bacterium]|nr:hypothetical protein [Candidatus Rokubacteria bacterium]
MSKLSRSLVAIVLGASLLHPGLALAQPRALTESECQGLRQWLAAHAKVSDGVRRSVATLAAASPAPPPAAAPAPKTAPVGAEAIRARLAEIPGARQQLEDQRLGALVKFEFSRAAQLQRRIDALDRERVDLEKQLASLPAASSAPSAPASPAPPAPAPAVSDVDRVRCQDLPAALEAAVKIRQKELGAREGQPGAVPLVPLKGQTGEQLARELAAQFGAWPDAATQVGLLDVDGDARLDAFVDVPLKDVFRLYRQRADGTFAIEVLAPPGRNASAEYGELARRLDEALERHRAATLSDALASRPSGTARVVGETGEFARAHAQVLAGNFADAARIDGPAARSREFENYRGDKVRLLEIIAPAPAGLMLRRVVVSPRPNNQEQWEETVALIRPVSPWRADVEASGSRETRTAAGAPVGARTTLAPAKFSLER